MQQGRFVARQIAGSVSVPEKARERFAYRDKGIMATIGRSRAVASIGGVRLSGFIAWLAWLLLHIVYLIDFRSRIVVLIRWAWQYLTYEVGSRLITGHRLEVGAPASARETAAKPIALPKSDPAKSLSP